MRYLSGLEFDTLVHLARGETSAEIRKQLGISKEIFRARCGIIRRKTGIKNVKSVAECHAWIAKNPEPTNPNRLPK